MGNLGVLHVRIYVIYTVKLEVCLSAPHKNNTSLNTVFNFCLYIPLYIATYLFIICQETCHKRLCMGLSIHSWSCSVQIGSCQDTLCMRDCLVVVA